MQKLCRQMQSKESSSSDDPTKYDPTNCEPTHHVEVEACVCTKHTSIVSLLFTQMHISHGMNLSFIGCTRMSISMLGFLGFPVSLVHEGWIERSTQCSMAWSAGDERAA